MSADASPSDFAVAAAYSMLVDRLTAEVVDEFRRRDLESILLKGPAVASWLYGPHELRSYSDCDLLVPPDQLHRAQDVLRDLGFRDYLQPLGHPRLDSHSWRRGGDWVDLHSTLIGLRADPRVVWQTLSSMTERHGVGGTTVPVLAPTARALHLALHAVQHGKEEAKPLEDLRRAIRALPPAAWEDVAALARRLDGTEAFATGLRLLPEGAALASRLGLSDVRSADAELRADPVPLAQGFEHLAATRGLRARVALVLKELFPTPTFMRWWSPLARRGPLGLAAAYCWRPIWLTWHVIPGFLAWRRARGSAP